MGYIFILFLSRLSTNKIRLEEKMCCFVLMDIFALSVEGFLRSEIRERQQERSSSFSSLPLFFLEEIKDETVT